MFSMIISNVNNAILKIDEINPNQPKIFPPISRGIKKQQFFNRPIILTYARNSMWIIFIIGEALVPIEKY